MVNVSLDDIRARVGALICGDEWVTGTAATSGSGTTTLAYPFPPLLDPAQPDTAGIYEHAWLLLTAAARTTTGRERRVSGWAASTGVLTFAPAVSGSVANTDTFEVWVGPFRPTFVEFAVNEALISQRIWEEVTFTGTANQKQYAVATVAGDSSLLNRRQLVDLALRVEVTSGQYDWQTIDPTTYEITADRGVLTLNFLSQTYTSADTIRIRWWRSLSSVGALSTGATTIPLVNDSEIIDWCAWETWYWLLSAPLANNLTRGDLDAQAALTKRVKAWVDHYRERFNPRVSRTFFRAATSSRWGS